MFYVTTKHLSERSFLDSLDQWSFLDHIESYLECNYNLKLKRSLNEEVVTLRVVAYPKPVTQFRSRFIFIGEHLFTTKMDRSTTQAQFTWYGFRCRSSLSQVPRSLFPLEGVLAPAASFADMIWVPGNSLYLAWVKLNFCSSDIIYIVYFI